MNRRPPNFPPGIWQARRDYGRHRSNVNDSNHVNSTLPYSYSFQAVKQNLQITFKFHNSYRESDPVPWRPAGETMITRILDIGSSPPEETPAIVRIIAHSRPRQLEANPRPAELPRFEGDSTLTSEEQSMALNKLKKKIYDPPKHPARRISLYYRDNSRGNYNERSTGDNDEDGKRCAVCLEDFQPKEEVLMTPCNHMFHEQCIVPWVKSNGQCPVCRSTLFERTARRASSNNAVPNVLTNNLEDDELVYIIRAMEEALMLRSLAGFWGA